eukprot:PITA_02437
MPLTLHLRLVVASALLLFLCSITSSLGGRYQDCSSGRFPYGGFAFGYPFGKIGSGCGDPDFQLDCHDQSGHPLLIVNGNEYRMLYFTYSGNNAYHATLTIVNNKLFGNTCNLSDNYSQFWSSGSLFHVLDTVDTNLTLWKGCDPIPNQRIAGDPIFLCGDYWNYSFSPHLKLDKPCNGFQLPITKYSAQQPIDNNSLLASGFEVKVQVDPISFQICDACLKSSGRCGYGSSNRTTFLCICPDDTSTPDVCSSNGGRSKLIIIGCSIGGAVLVAIVAVLLFLGFYAKKTIRKQPFPPPPRSSISKVEKFLREYAYEMPTRYSYSQLKKITNNFAEKLGEGGFGVVYKGKLRNGALVAVKLLDRHRHSQTQFMNEVATIGHVHHVNLVRLLGYCFQTHTSALVYEYMVNGSLEKFIFAGKEKGRVLRWQQLYSIALGAARGIAYLHHECEKRIIHFDIKPHNILLDSEFTPKISDFGLAKLCGKRDDHISMTVARGTPGYVAPEVWSKDAGPVTDKSDVYSFGMLLLEIVGGRKNMDVQVSRSSQQYFPEWAFKFLESGELGMRLRGGEMEVEDEEKARRVAKIGLWCIQYNYRDRPCMSRVVQMLEGNEDDVISPPVPFNSSSETENHVLYSIVTSSTEIETRL